MRIFTIPNIITSMNLVAGIVGVVFCLYGQINIALVCMLVAAFFDFFDGLAARILHSVSPIGKELDSLSDMVSFGVLPALMLLMTMRQAGSVMWATWIPLILAVLSAFRLAKFNVDERQNSDFLGVPTPTAAIISGALAHFIAANPETTLASLAGTFWFIPLVAILLGGLLVSEIPMFSIKVAKGHKLLDTIHLVLVAIILLSVLYTALEGKDWSLAVLLVFSLYIFENLVIFLVSKFKK